MPSTKGCSSLQVLAQEITGVAKNLGQYARDTGLAADFIEFSENCPELCAIHQDLMELGRVLDKVAVPSLPPTYVFVVEAGYDYEGSRVLGVAATLRAARKLIGVTSRLRWRKGKGSPMWSACVYDEVSDGRHYDWVSITCAEVKGG